MFENDVFSIELFVSMRCNISNEAGIFLKRDDQNNKPLRGFKKMMKTQLRPREQAIANF